MEPINVWTVLLNSPQQLINREQDPEAETFFQMISNLLAPYYKLKSFTSVLMAISVIIYIALVAPYPPFLKIPTYALQGLVLLPQHLKHYEFYRLFTAPFVYQDLTALILGVLLIWCLGSYTEEAMGWKVFVVLTGLSGLVGFANSFTIPLFLMGCKFSEMVTKWADPQLPLMYRKVMLIIYFIGVGIFILLFISYKREEQFNFYASALYGFLMASALGFQNGNQFSTFRKLLSTFALLSLSLMSWYLLINIIFNKTTFI